MAQAQGYGAGARMIPVLAADDPARAAADLVRLFGCVPMAPGRVRFGSATIALVAPDERPGGFIALPLDHVAFSVPEAAAAAATYGAAGATLQRTFTPDGVRGIPEFWDHGVRFVFFEGPGGAAFEFCEKTGAGLGFGHSHYGLRTRDLDATEAACRALGAVPLVRYRLGSGEQAVNVRFLQRGSDIFELFDEPATGPISPSWIGLLPA